jgi:3-deoxy-D-manno-octulosonate 8-phosphate phosphatase (KDO 8-P phosphatase)
MNILEKFKPITTFVFDVDGVLTNGQVLAMQNGEQARFFNIKDGYALQLAVKMGYHVVIISGAKEASVEKRLQHLGIKNIYLGEKDKKTCLHQFMQANNLQKEQVLFMGDDIPDYSVMQTVGLPCCPKDAVPEIHQIALYIAPQNGGTGCARDVIEKTLKLNNHWPLETTVVAK